MIKKSLVATLIFSCGMLSGCASISSAAESLGVNFWSHNPKKAPCKTASLSTTDVPCIGVKIPKPDEDYIHTLRGLYVFV